MKNISVLVPVGLYLEKLYAANVPIRVEINMLVEVTKKLLKKNVSAPVASSSSLPVMASISVCLFKNMSI
jgi:hypothetical protein